MKEVEMSVFCSKNIIILAFHPKAQRLVIWQVFWLGFLLNTFPLIEQLLTSTVVLNSAGE